MDSTGLNDLFHDLSSHVDRHGETDTDVAPARRKDRGVDAYELAFQIDQSATRIPRIDRGVGLDEVFIALFAQAGAAEGADEARRHGLAEAKWVTHRNHKVADLQPVAVAQRQCLQIAAVLYLQ